MAGRTNAMVVGARLEKITAHMEQWQTVQGDPQDNYGWHEERYPLVGPWLVPHRPDGRSGAGQRWEVGRRSPRRRARPISSERRSRPRAHYRQNQTGAVETFSSAFRERSYSGVHRQKHDRPREPYQVPYAGSRMAMGSSKPVRSVRTWPAGCHRRGKRLPPLANSGGLIRHG